MPATLRPIGPAERLRTIRILNLVCAYTRTAYADLDKKLLLEYRHSKNSNEFVKDLQVFMYGRYLSYSDASYCGRLLLATFVVTDPRINQY